MDGPLNGLGQPLSNEEDHLAVSPAGSLATTTIFGCVATIAVLARTWARLHITRQFGIDDLVIISALLVGLGCNVMHEIATHNYDFGKSLHAVLLDNVWKSARANFIFYLLYLTASFLVKISILYFYRTILRGSHGPLLRYKRANYFLMAVVTILYVVFTFNIAFACNPPEAYWLQLKPDYAESFTCSNIDPSLLGAGYTSLFTDIAIVLLPLIFIRHLQIHRRERWALRGLFFVCVLPCVAGLLRVAFLQVALKQTELRSYYGFFTSLFANLEVHTGIVCASAPHLKPLFRTYFGSHTVDGSFSFRTGSRTGSSRRWNFWPSTSSSNGNASVDEQKPRYQRRYGPFSRSANTSDDTRKVLGTHSDAELGQIDGTNTLGFGTRSERSPSIGVMKRVDIEVNSFSDDQKAEPDFERRA